MKKKLLVMFAILVSGCATYGQFTFSVSPGLSLNAASFGYKFNKVVPFIGFQYFGTSASYDYNYKDFDFNSGTIVDMSQSSKGRVNLIMPNIGAKYFLFEKENVKASATLNFTKPIIAAKAEIDGEDDEFLNDAIKGISLWAGELSFGAEYFFSEQFSLGGEFGFRYIHFNSQITETRTIFNPITFETVETEATYDTKINASPTFSKIGLNFYF